MDNLKVEEITSNDEVGKIINEELSTKYCEKYILYGKDRTCLTDYFLEYVEQIQNFEVNNDDIWVASYPKTGTTWTQEMVWLIANNLDYEGAKQIQSARFPYLEISALFDEEKRNKVMKIPESENTNSIEICAKLKRPRFIKSHLPFSLLPDQIKNQTKTPKLVYVWRNPKDTCVSYYHHGVLLDGWVLDLESFAKVFLDEKVMYSPYWKHIFGYWDHRDRPNILMVKYEDMKADLPSVIRKVAKFLEKPITEEQITLLAKYLNFESMKNNQAANKSNYVDKLLKHKIISKGGDFMRSGTVGKYKEELSPETIKRFDAWIKENITGTSLEEEYDYNI